MTNSIEPRGHHVRLTSAGKRYGHTTALTEVDLEVQPGTFLVLLERVC